jgi:hypothetical protein
VVGFSSASFVAAGKEVRKAVAYLRTSSRTNVGADKDSDKRQRVAIEAYAKAAGYEIIDTFYAKIRCCTFRTRSLWYLTSDYMHGKEPVFTEELLCIDLVHRKFRDAEFTVDISFSDYVSFFRSGDLIGK